MKQCLIKSQSLLLVTFSFISSALFAFWHIASSKVAPVGYQDEDGFHYGVRKS